MVGAARRLATELVVIMASATHEIHAVVGTFALAREAAIGCSAGMSIALICASWVVYRTVGTHVHAVGDEAGSPQPGELSPDDVQLPGGVVQASSALVGDGDDVLDADAEIAGEVDPGLDREAHARNERLLLALDHVRRLVGGDADAVAGPVDELFAVARIGDDLTGGPVDVLARHSGSHGLDAGLLGLAHDFVDLADLCGGFTDAHRAAGVRPVAEHQPAE